MKKTVENLYPHSAALFRFCKEALEIRYDGNVKVIDQDVGAILGYDPADCSHWKKGKKNIRALSTLRNIADHLQIDEQLLIGIASGKVGLQEAIFEYKGYGNFSMSEHPLEKLKKEFFKNPAKWQIDNRIRTFDELFNIDRDWVLQTVRSVLSMGSFEEAPIHVQEVYGLFPQVSLVMNPALEQEIEVDVQDAGEDGKGWRATVAYQSTEMKPYLRFLLLKELFGLLCASKQFDNITPAPAEVRAIQSSIFALHILIPDHLLLKEVETFESSQDIVAQLTNVFWVPKSLMNIRLRER
ncbi:MAG: hypothetical protein OYH77_04905 [Pseudomonadota bacterium]|nr:hypothetical protein [Pseudomonadota bacterium]